jgi:ketosteroid isomerase-like protein
MSYPRRVHVVVPGLLSLCLAWACAPAPTDTTEEARAGIAAANARFMELVAQKDAAGLAALYTEDARMFPPGSPPVIGRAAIQQVLGGLVGGIARLQLDTVDVAGYGNAAYEQEALKFFDANGVLIDEGKAIVIWKKVDGEWKLHRDIFNSNLPPPPPPAPEETAVEDAAAEAPAETGSGESGRP